MILLVIFRYILKVLIYSSKIDLSGPLILRSGSDPCLTWVSTPLSWRLGTFYDNLDTSDSMMLEMKSNATDLFWSRLYDTLNSLIT